MPAITYDQFLTASTLALQGGGGGSASGIHRDWVKQLLPSALNRLAEVVAEDPPKRPLLLKVIEVTIANQGNSVWQGTVNTDTPTDPVLGCRSPKLDPSLLGCLAFECLLFVCGDVELVEAITAPLNMRGLFRAMTYASFPDKAAGP